LAAVPSWRPKLSTVRPGEPGRAALWQVLDAASFAALLGDREAAGERLLAASGHAAGLPCRPALAVILTAIWDGSRDEVTAWSP
jgi:hypothetical protein